MGKECIGMEAALKEYPLPAVFEDFADARRKAFITMKELKDAGKKVVGVYCGFAPWEIIAASGAVAAWLCGMDEEPIAAAERELPRNTCPLIKSSYGFAVTDTCPFFYFSDLLIGETTCDGKKKAYELIGRIKPMHVVHIPNSPVASGAYALYHEELVRLRSAIEHHLGVTIHDEAIREKIVLRNEERRALREFYEMGRMDPPPLWGFDLRKVLEGTKYITDKEVEIVNIRNLREQILKDYLEKGSPVPASAKRILVTGSPLGDSTEKVIRLIEENGGVVVCYENCASAKNLDDLVDETGDPIDALCRRHLKSGCACMSPNEQRKSMIDSYIDEYKVDGVVDVVLTCCHTYNVETGMIKRIAQGKSVPYLNLETDYSQSDIGQLSTRIAAFIEIL